MRLSSATQQVLYLITGFSLAMLVQQGADDGPLKAKELVLSLGEGQGDARITADPEGGIVVHPPAGTVNGCEEIRIGPDKHSWRSGIWLHGNEQDGPSIGIHSFGKPSRPCIEMRDSAGNVALSFTVGVDGVPSILYRPAAGEELQELIPD